MIEKGLKIVAGLTCAGKTTFCKQQEKSPYFVTFDRIFDYSERKIKEDKFREHIEEIQKGNKRDYFLMDAYNQNVDELRDCFLRNDIKINNVEVIFLYVFSVEEHIESCIRKWGEIRFFGEFPEKKTSLIRSCLLLEKYYRNCLADNKIQKLTYTERTERGYESFDSNFRFLNIWKEE